MCSFLLDSSIHQISKYIIFIKFIRAVSTIEADEADFLRDKKHTERTRV